MPTHHFERPSVLLCSIPVHGHVTPLLGVARALRERGVDVRMLTGERFRDAVLAAGAEFVPLPAAADYDDRKLNERFPGRVGLTGIRQIKYDVQHMFLGPMQAQYDAVRAELGSARPDVILAEPGFFGAAAIAAMPLEQRAPLFMLCVVPMPLPSIDTAPAGLGLPPMRGVIGRLRNRLLMSVLEHVVFGGIHRALRVDFRNMTGYELQASIFGMPGLADLFLEFSVESFEYPRSDLPANVRFVGPAVRVTPTESFDAPSWWHELDDATVVHVTQGTLANDDFTELVAPTLRALEREDDILVVVSTGGRDVATVEAAFGQALPRNVRVAEYLPYDLLLPRVDVMVTNGGFGGVQLALQHGIPLVVAGQTEDKVEVCARVAWSGAGVNLKAQRPTADAVANAVRTVLRDPSYRTASGRIGADVARSGGVDEVARLVIAAATTADARSALS